MTNTFAEEYNIPIHLKYDIAREFYIRIAVADLKGRSLPPVFTNIFRKKQWIECQTLELMKRNQKVRITYSQIVHLTRIADYNLASRSHFDE